MDSSPNVEDTPSGKDQSSRLAMERKPTQDREIRWPRACQPGHHRRDGGHDEKDEVRDDAVRGARDFRARSVIVSPLAFILIPRATSSASGGGAERDDRDDRGDLGEGGAVVARDERLLRSRLVDGIAPFAAAWRPTPGAGT